METKYQVDKRTLVLLLNHYRDYLVAKFPNRLVTASFRVELQRELDAYQLKKAKTESFFVWKIPMKALSNSVTSDIDVEPAVEVEVL